MSRGTETRQERPEDQDLVKKGYTFVKKIGSGSYGKVWLAEFHNDGRSMKLACKIVNLERMPPKFARKFFPRELDIIMWVDHAYVIRTHSILERQHQVFIFMQYADSGDLLDYLKKYGVLPEINAHIWFKQLTLGLQYLHGKKVAHRDLKCENLLLTKNFNIKIADFGFARYVVDSDGKRVLSETYCGSAAYAAPEVIRGTPYNPVMSDIWSAGVVLYVMVNPSMPFDDSDAKKLLRNQETRNWAFRSSVRDRLTPAIKDVVTRMLEPDVTSRITLDQILRHEWLSENTLKELVAEHDAMKKTKEQEKRAQPIPGQQALRVPGNH
ncbi:unnamed protein product [Darwinula stevensoni]|uniref:Protein kinase domain-containing protein n=1 Tax=Darwinula stevensoni TaxID=69355 RepID=A0A7R8XDG8_9CRUS|nr:unnamed protein product [Darwinula stevensoni]CAG0893025.1 unnamed protein product [Darwinula stevensoni]